MIPPISKRLNSLPPYPFAEFDRKKNKALQEGKDVISFGVGDPDMPTPGHIVEAGKKALEDPKNHQYPFGKGLAVFREAVAHFYERRFGVKLDAASEIHSCLGSKDALAHFHFAYINRGDYVLVPSPSYPVYNIGAIFTDGKAHLMPLTEKNGFLPELDSVPAAILRKTKILFLNSPNNPTSAVAGADYFKKAIALARKYKFIIAHDAAYSEIYFEKPPISFLSVPGAKDVGVEFHSCSKTYNMTGWRVGWFCGNAEIVAALGKVKDNFDSGVFQAMQKAAVTALTASQDCVEEMRRVYRARRDLLVPGLQKLGFKAFNPEAAFYVWVKNPKGYSSAQTAGKIFDDAHVVVIPGTGFGKHGEGYIRFALTVSTQRIETALERLAKISW